MFALIFKQQTKLLSECREEKKALILGGGGYIDFLDIGLSLALEVFFPLGSDYIVTAQPRFFTLIFKDKIMARNHLLLLLESISSYLSSSYQGL